jgi:hypothetical protein
MAACLADRDVRQKDRDRATSGGAREAAWSGRGLDRRPYATYPEREVAMSARNLEELASF